MENNRKQEIEEEIKKLEAEKKAIEDNESTSKEELTKQEVFDKYEIPDDKKREEIFKDLNKMYNVSLYLLVIGVVGAALVYFLSKSVDNTYSYVLGCLTSMFTYSVMVKDYKNLTYIHISHYKSSLVKSYIKRFAISLAILFFVFVFQDRGFSLVYTFLGMISLKLAVYLFVFTKKGGIN